MLKLDRGMNKNRHIHLAGTISNQLLSWKHFLPLRLRVLIYIVFNQPSPSGIWPHGYLYGWLPGSVRQWGCCWKSSGLDGDTPSRLTAPPSGVFRSTQPTCSPPQLGPHQQSAVSFTKLFVELLKWVVIKNNTAIVIADFAFLKFLIQSYLKRCQSDCIFPENETVVLLLF